MSKRYPAGPRFRVNVSKELITKAIAADSSRCWIAEAIKEAYPKATTVAVDVSTVRFSDLDKGHRYVYVSPYSVQLALLDFDEGRPPVPFTFVLHNAHVTKAGGTPILKKQKDKARRAKQHARVGATAILVGGKRGSGNLPRKVGGRRPPQLRHVRLFGVRAFRGMSLERLAADEALRARADGA